MTCAVLACPRQALPHGFCAPCWGYYGVVLSDPRYRTQRVPRYDVRTGMTQPQLRWEERRA